MGQKEFSTDNNMMIRAKNHQYQQMTIRNLFLANILHL